MLLAMGAAGQTPYVHTETPRYEPHAWVRGGERFPAGARLLLGQRAIASGFAASADAAVSFDGERVVFAGKRTARDAWGIWEAPLAGGGPRMVAAEGVRPLYLPEDKVVYARGFQLYVQPLAGAAALRQTYAPGNFLPCDVLEDGRILFAGTHPSGVTELYAVFSDGSGVEAYRCHHGVPRDGARQLRTGEIVFETGGTLARFTPALAEQQGLRQPPGEFAGPPAEIAPGRWLVAFRPMRSADFGLYRMAAGTLTAAGNGVQPVAIAPREAPPYHPSALHNRDGGNLLCLSAYASKAKIREGSVATVRLYTVQGLLEERTVEPDGSFYLRNIPTEKPLRLELADRDGKVVRAEKGWWWMRRGEQRVCAGCHAGPERAPENRVPQVLLKAVTPEVVSSATPVRRARK